MRLFSHLVLALCLMLGCFAPPAQAENREVPYLALAPLALTTGYFYAGRWDRAIIAPIAVTTLVAAGAMGGFMLATDKDTMHDPIGACLGILVLPAAGGLVGLGLGTTLVLVDQAFLAGWVAPAITTATLLGLTGLQYAQPF
ncbi:MAG: hypothetical protein JWM80_953 [Cyanobacteria bacterium RYN_339]|nr:hypothetical protein [Cyanobacteria bacterium RYN_339]